MSVLTDIVKSISSSEYFNDLMQKHKTNGVPTSAWKSLVNTLLSLTWELSKKISDLSQSITNMVSAAFLDYATGDGLRLFAKSQYQIDYNPAQFTSGIVRLISTASAPSYTFVPGQVTVGTQTTDASTQKLYVNVTGGTLAPPPMIGPPTPGNGYLDLTFIAIAPGSKYNIPNQTTLDLKTSFVGLFVSNPIYPVLDNWIAQQGADIESDESLKSRCRAKWGTLGVGSNRDAFEYWARSIPPGYTSSPVSKVKIASNIYKGAYVPGSCTVYIAGPAGALAPLDIAAVQGVFDNPQKYANNSFVSVETVINKNIAVKGTVFIKRSAGLSLLDAQAQVEAHLLEYQGILDIGQGIFPQKLGARIEDANVIAIRNVKLTDPDPNTVDVINLNYYEYPILQYTSGNLSYVLVD